MKLLVCGAGKITRELVRQLGDEWLITLIDKSGLELDKAAALSPDIIKIIPEDASSPVVLEKAGISEFDYVLALTNDDSVNRTAADIALKAGVPHVCAMISEMDDPEDLRKKGVHVLQSTKLLFGDLYHYLQNPRIHVLPMRLGPASLMEVKASDHKQVVGKRAGFFKRRRARLAGIIRDNRLLFPTPDTRIKEEDRLVILGNPDIFQSVCGMLECGTPNFPLAYGSGMLVVPGDGPLEKGMAVMNEAQFIARNSQVKSVTVLNPAEGRSYEKNLVEWPQDISPEIKAGNENMNDSIREVCRDGNFGLVVIPPMEESVFSFLSGPAYVGLADDIVRPLLVAKGTAPYERILVPFHGTPMGEQAFEIGADLSRRLNVHLCAVIVEEPDFIVGRDEAGRLETIQRRLTELSHVCKVRPEILVRRGNPVRELVTAGADYDLMIIGCTNRRRSLFSPNVGELLAREAPCSTLMIAL